MADSVKKTNRFNLRIQKKSTQDDIYKLSELLGKSANAIINMALEEGLKVLKNSDNNDSSNLQNMISNIVKKETKDIKANITQLRVEQFVLERMVASIYQHLLFFINNSFSVNLPAQYSERYDTTSPEQFDNIKREFLISLYDEDSEDSQDE